MDILVRWCSLASKTCWKGTTSQRNRIKNLPTTSGRYRWIIFSCLLILTHLWYWVTYTTSPFSTNTFRYWRYWVSQCWTLRISVPLAGCPPRKCIRRSIFSRNIPIVFIQLEIGFSCHWPCCRNIAWCVEYWPVWLDNQFKPRVTKGLGGSCRKFHPWVQLEGLSCKLVQEIWGGSTHSAETRCWAFTKDSIVKQSSWLTLRQWIRAFKLNHTDK